MKRGKIKRAKYIAGYWLLPYAHNLTFSQFTGILSQQIYDEKMFGPFYQLVAERQKEIPAKSSDKINEELRQTIDYLVNRVNELEAAENNKQVKFLFFLINQWIYINTVMSKLIEVYFPRNFSSILLSPLMRSKIIKRIHGDITR